MITHPRTRIIGLLLIVASVAATWLLPLPTAFAAVAGMLGGAGFGVLFGSGVQLLTWEERWRWLIGKLRLSDEASSASGGASRSA